MDSERFASPIKGIFCGGLNAYCMHIKPLFLRTSGSSGVLKALLLERNGQLSCNPKKKRVKKQTVLGCIAVATSCAHQLQVEQICACLIFVLAITTNHACSSCHSEQEFTRGVKQFAKFEKLATLGSLLSGSLLAACMQQGIKPGTAL